ncbi:Glycosyl transferase, group 1 [Candidatus Methylobacter favarea]|uniref:Glycosyl transferase, group 1 n=1 Tax=Candidatus Methylobacter favarea TaxID=2707345 RepID=A0A8S0Y8W5_9GAMM|nr:TIGR03087 family PEP-CTERM/XrtA system glycosyltransferase [Candidatus Methylobacter favarea]CAA9889366.1 Glycosyl transferase, group 1 [Candidatus Methylobacter favarea]
MKDLLFLAHRIPYPPNKGDKIRSCHFLKHLASTYTIHLGTFIDDANDWQYTEILDSLCAETFYMGLKPQLAKIKSLRGLLTNEALSLPYYRNQAMQDWVDHIIKTRRIKKVLIYSSVMAQFINASHDIDMIVDFVDVDSDKWRQYADKKQGLAKWIYQREAQYLFNYEKTIAEKSKVSFFVSEQEAALFKRLAPELEGKITHINNGVDTDHFSPDHLFASPYHDNEEALVFTGAMDYWANVDAVTWFGNAVFPRLQKYPQAKFYIVGSKPSKEVCELANNKNIIVTGAVDDVRPYVAHARLVVAPLRIARGIQNKVLEAMAMAKYVVATSAAMEGIPSDQTLDVSVGDEVDVIVQQLDKIMQDNGAEIISNNNRDFVKAMFSWEQNVNQLSALFQ